MRLFLILFLLILPASLHAACTGTDLRTVLTPEQRAEIAQRLKGVPYAEGTYWQRPVAPGHSISLARCMWMTQGLIR